MDGMMTERVQALKELLGPDATQQLLAFYGNGQTTKAAGMRTTLKATSPVDDAVDALDAFLETVTTDANQKALADQVTAFTAQLQKQLGAKPASPVKSPAKTTDSGPQSVAAKSTRTGEAFWDLLAPGVPHSL